MAGAVDKGAWDKRGKNAIVLRGSDGGVQAGLAFGKRQGASSRDAEGRPVFNWQVPCRRCTLSFGTVDTIEYSIYWAKLLLRKFALLLAEVTRQGTAYSVQRSTGYVGFLRNLRLCFARSGLESFRAPSAGT